MKRFATSQSKPILEGHKAFPNEKNPNTTKLTICCCLAFTKTAFVGNLNAVASCSAPICIQGAVNHCCLQWTPLHKPSTIMSVCGRVLVCVRLISDFIMKKKVLFTVSSHRRHIFRKPKDLKQ